MKLRQTLWILLLTVLLTACGPAAVAEPTAAPIPTTLPTPTTPPTPEDILAAGWQAFDDDALENAEAIARQLLDTHDLAYETETGAKALLGMTELANNQTRQALEDLEEARKQGYTDREIAPVMFDAYIGLIENNIEQLYQTYDFETIQTLSKETTDLYRIMNHLPKEVKDIPQEIIDLVDRNNIQYMYIDFGGEPFDLLVEGETLLDQGAYAQAQEKFEAALEILPDNLILQLLLGRISVELGNYDQAIAQFNQILAQEPNAYHAYTWLASIYETINLPQHAHEAIINLAFISNKDLESILDIQEAVETYQQSMQPNLFNQYGFSLSLPFEFTLLDIQGNETTGLAFIQEVERGLVIVWGLPGTETFEEITSLEEWINTPPEELASLGTMELVGEPIVFPYNPEKIYVQQFTFELSENMGSILGIKAGWQCGETLYGMSYAGSQFTSSTNLTTEKMYHALYPLFESVSCDVPNPSQIQGSANIWLAKH